MRLALIQTGQDYPSLTDQLALLEPLRPDSFHVEETVTSQSGQRVIERLETLRSGDEVCLCSLAILRLDVGETTRLVMDLIDRGIACHLAVPGESVELISSETPARLLLRRLADLQADREAGRPPVGQMPPLAGRRLLQSFQLNQVRRLAGAGMSARRIGLIFRRTPDCIHALIHDTPAGGAAACATQVTR